jgi:glycosyltransferase involved in cell wall biosynthesis
VNPGSVANTSSPVPAGTRPWRVLHACEFARDVLPVVESELAVGMKPAIVTAAGSSPEALLQTAEETRSPSLLNAWNDVRVWRRSLLQSGMPGSGPGAAELVHAHSFSAGMAAVRNCPAVVYDVSGFVENQPEGETGPVAEKDFPGKNAAAKNRELSWLGRSFRVAEQFVLTRAGAVVTHSGAIHQGVLQRGVAAENHFQIPPPMPAELLDALGSPAHSWLSQRRLSEDDSINFFAADLQPGDDGNALTQEMVRLLEGFVLLRSEAEKAKLFLPAAAATISGLLEKARALGIADAVHAVPFVDREQVLAAADVVIAGDLSPFPELRRPPASSAEFSSADREAGEVAHADSSADSVTVENSAPSSFRNSNFELRTTVMQAFLCGRPLLASDCTEHRDISAHGRGLIWYRAGDVRDFARRGAFLAGNPDLRRVLAASGRRHLLETRSPEAIGRQYDEVYRHAFSRRRESGVSPASGATLQPLFGSP